MCCAAGSPVNAAWMSLTSSARMPGNCVPNSRATSNARLLRSASARVARAPAGNAARGESVRRAGATCFRAYGRRNSRRSRRSGRARRSAWETAPQRRPVTILIIASRDGSSRMPSGWRVRCNSSRDARKSATICSRPQLWEEHVWHGEDGDRAGGTIQSELSPEITAFCAARAAPRNGAVAAALDALSDCHAARVDPAHGPVARVRDARLRR